MTLSRRRAGRSTELGVGLLIAGLVGITMPMRVARAAPATESDESAQAKSLFEKGMAHYHLEEYDQAIDKWEQGFRLRPAPEFLYNIAQAHRLARRYEKSVSFYQKYLRLAPKAPNRGEVERHIAALEKTIRTTPSPAPPVEPMPSPTPTPTPVVAAPVAPTPVVAAPVAASNTIVVTPPVKKPIYKRGWFWGVIGGSVVVVVGAGVVAGVLVSRNGQPGTLPAVRF